MLTICKIFEYIIQIIKKYCTKINEDCINLHYEDNTSMVEWISAYEKRKKTVYSKTVDFFTDRVTSDGAVNSDNI